jgi:lysozyme
MKTRSRAAVAGMVASAALIVGLAVEEDFRSRAYQDIVGVWTYGFGSTTKADGTPVKSNDTIGPVQALQRKLKDVQKFEGAVKQCVKVPLHQYEYDAYLSLAYNIGTGAFCNSTLVRRLNAQDYEGACKEILKWNRAGGRPVQGLTNRREREYRQCIGEGQ